MLPWYYSNNTRNEIKITFVSCWLQVENVHGIPSPESATYGNASGRLPSANITFTSYLTSRKYFIDVEDQLRHEFAFKPHILAAAQRRLETVTPSSWKRKDFVRVVIHVRRGDMLTARRIRLGWLPPEPDYFNEAIAFFNRCHKLIQYIVISENMSWCRKNIIGTNVVYLTGAKTPAEDMAVASLSDHAIITVGSFGWWMGWFANGITIAQNITKNIDCKYETGCIIL